MKQEGIGDVWIAGQGKPWEEHLPTARSAGLPASFYLELETQSPTIYDQFGRPIELDGNPSPEQPE